MKVTWYEVDYGDFIRKYSPHDFAWIYEGIKHLIKSGAIKVERV